MTIRTDAERLWGDLVELRRALHQEPEIGLQLPKTQAKVLNALDGLELEITTGDALTSVTAVLRGGRPGRTVLLRADMDALEMTEKLDLPYRSVNQGAMHACGHDLHTAMLVGAARLLAARRDRLTGDVVFMFQPGEEGCDGAGHMIAEGVLDVSGQQPSAAFALHVLSAHWERGTFVTRPGPLMSASDGLYVTVRGRGGHGSAPHHARDPIPATCEMVTALQTMLTREIDPFEFAVLTVGSLHAGTRRNIIPDQASFEATIRTLDPDVRRQVEKQAIRLVEAVAAGHGVDAEIHYEPEYPVAVNAEEQTAFTTDIITELFGADRFREVARPFTGSEDFSRILAEVPGAMVFLSAAPTEQDPATAAPNHSPLASFDDAVLADGAVVYAELALRQLAQPADDGSRRHL
ncbi:M20 metallopeptidase family protein [Parasphingorhabdus pacifica]